MPTKYASKDLKALARPISTLRFLPGNPNAGGNDAELLESLERFGQTKNIVGYQESDGTITVVAGNHVLEKMVELGWDEAAVVVFENQDEAEALAYALYDNETGRRSKDDPVRKGIMITRVLREAPESLKVLGFDEFKAAALSISETIPMKATKAGEGWTPPQMLDTPAAPFTTPASQQLSQFSEEDDLVARGVPNQRAKVQYTILFDDESQQRAWYTFLRYLKSDPVYKDFETTAAQLTAFIEDHASF